ncbi:type IV conjugative transfer system lipoprotein TraV [Marinobacterium aestuariivivens]|uniref:Type IV conjugative transfer system lipoprotein TraV n=1 Tax=Marinobacterium aestuariivivens TaxID=1698799 RepID=A0ABW2A9F0_9GAMM
MLNFTKKGRNAGVGSRRPSVPFMRMLMVGGLLTTVTGCSSLNIGNSEYACPGMPSGVQCMSARDVYAATNDGQVPRPMSPEEIEATADSTPDKTGQRASPSSPLKSSGDEVINNYVAPRLPNKPVPIRTPAQVMRIWIAPWEDTNGDLIVTGYIYTEIEPRRWVIGDSTPESEPVIRPLQSVK